MNEGHLGFSGTQVGMSYSQVDWFGGFILRNNPSFFHHGICIGSDFQAHNIVRSLLPKCVIVGHPPTNTSKMALGVRCDIMREPKPYLERNHDIVDESERFVGMPRYAYEELRSGTWATIRYARRRHEQGQHLSITIVDP